MIDSLVVLTWMSETHVQGTKWVGKESDDSGATGRVVLHKYQM